MPIGHRVWQWNGSPRGCTFFLFGEFGSISYPKYGDRKGLKTKPLELQVFDALTQARSSDPLSAMLIDGCLGAARYWPKMKAAKTILVLLIALSVALLPRVGGASFATKAADTTVEAVMEDMDCCPSKSNPCDNAMDGCTSMATCALKCFSFTPGSLVSLRYPVGVAGDIPLPFESAFHSQTSSPPFRPPRV
jgi:hypothetical protein